MARKNYYAARAVQGNDEIIYCGFDTETEGLGGKLLSMQYGSPYKDVVFDAQDDGGMVDRFYKYISQYPEPCVWYCHNAQYDWRYLMDYCIEKKLDVSIGMRTDHDVYEISFKNAQGRKVIMRDSFALFNSSLKKLAASFCPELPKGDLDFDKETFDPKNEQHKAYAIRDVQILLVGLPRLASLLHKHFSVNPNSTFASTALKGWQKSLPDDSIFNASKYATDDDKARELYIRQAYYGGLVFLTDTKTHTNCVTYDINSSYPYAMMTYGVPYGRVAETRDFISDKLAIYKCRIKTPDNLVVPIIPARDSRGAMRWYRGEFDTVCTNRELVFAANHGYEILKIYDGLVWEETVYPFSDFIKKCMDIRREYHIPPDQGMAPEEYLAKFMQNSLYGKFGTRRERFRLMARHNMSDDELIGTEQWDEQGKWYVKKNDVDDGMRCMPEWATFITAHARLRLLETVYSVGVENVLYGDTDSITMKSGPWESRIDAGIEYGQFKKEKEWKEFRAIAPKVYSGILNTGDEIAPAKYSGAAKGLPRKNLTQQHWRELLEEGKSSAQALSLSSLRVSLKKGAKPANILLRKSSTLDNSTNFEKLQDGRVRAKIKA
jgi:DNA polymerase elongation subunit (family B)